MGAFAHWEDTDGSSPRHPIVCILDSIGLCSAIGFFWCRPTLTFAILPFAVGMQYLASCLYHWIHADRKIWWAFDHLAIAFLITMTYIQMWVGSSMPGSELHWRVLTLISAMFVVWILILAKKQNHAIHGLLYIALTVLGLCLSFLYPNIFPTRGWVDFVAGIMMYGCQQLILAVQSPDPEPGVFGYREVQHCGLLMASTTHLYVVAKYLAG
jgi:channel protein (hemolysin III family)